jgi:hypothetical protein
MHRKLYPLRRKKAEEPPVVSKDIPIQVLGFLLTEV